MLFTTPSTSSFRQSINKTAFAFPNWGAKVATSTPIGLGPFSLASLNRLGTDVFWTYDSLEKLRIECRPICGKGYEDGIWSGKEETYEDEDDEDDIADRGHSYLRRQPKWDALSGHGGRKETVEVEKKGCWS